MFGVIPAKQLTGRMEMNLPFQTLRPSPGRFRPLGFPSRAHVSRALVRVELLVHKVSSFFLFFLSTIKQKAFEIRHIAS